MAPHRPECEDATINAFCDALKKEYVMKRGTMVGDFFDENPDAGDPAFEQAEEQIRSCADEGDPNTKKYIEQLRNTWLNEYAYDEGPGEDEEATVDTNIPFMGEPARLEVTVLGAIDLPNVESMGGKNDPYCKVVMGGEKVFKTSVDKNTIDPAWGETGQFEWDGFNDLIFIIMDDDFFTKDDFIAQYIVPKEKLMQGVKGSYPLQVMPKYYVAGLNQAQITFKVGPAPEKGCGCSIQ